MARRKKKGRKGGYRRKKGVKKVPKTVKGVWKAQPLLVKGGMALTGIGIVSEPGPGGDPIFQLQNKQWSNFLNSVKANAMDPKKYYPVVIGVIAHKGAKMLGVKGL